MARKPNPPTNLPMLTPDANNVYEEISQELTTVDEATRAIAVAYGLRSLIPSVLMSEIKSFHASAVDAALNIGARLKVLREMTPHGEWESTLDELGFSSFGASRFMRLAETYKKPNRQNLLQLGKGQLEELMVLEDEKLDDLNAGKSVGGHTLDDVSGMTIKQMRQAIRELRSQAEAKNATILRKEEKINEIETELHNAKKFKPSAKSLAKTAQEERAIEALSSAVLEAEFGFRKLAMAAREILIEGQMSEAVMERARNDIRYMCQALADISHETGVGIDLDERIKPSWMIS